MTTTQQLEEDLIKGYESQYDITLEAIPETVRVRGNALASGDEQLDKETEDRILARLESGDVWAWFTAKVSVRDDQGREASDYLGACCYEDEKDFKRGGYYLDMIRTCIDELEILDDTIDTLSELEAMAEEDAVFDCTEKNAIMEAAWFAMRHHFKDLAEYLDLSDEYLNGLKNKLDKQLN